jgi:hypothetical protein
MLREARSITAKCSICEKFSPNVGARFRNSGQTKTIDQNTINTDEIQISKVAHSSGQWTEFGVGIKFIRIRNDLLRGKYMETHAI